MARRLSFWAVVAATVAVYAAMVLWSIPRIEAAAGGLPVFDMRPGGYGLEDARAFLAALSAEGREFYLRVQHRLDLVYPALMALATGWALVRLAPGGGAWRLMALVPVPGMVFDWLENAAVARMLAAGPEGLTAEMVSRASLWSQLKAGFTTVSLSLLLIFLALWALRRWQLR
jgi:hypothetical protein